MVMAANIGAGNERTKRTQRTKRKEGGIGRGMALCPAVFSIPSVGSVWSVWSVSSPSPSPSLPGMVKPFGKATVVLEIPGLAVEQALGQPVGLHGKDRTKIGGAFFALRRTPLA